MESASRPNMKMQPDLSVVICVYNEEDNIEPLVRQLDQHLSPYAFELVFVDDGSSDQTLSRLKELQHPRLRVVEFRRNFGQSAALAAGIQEARGEWIATMDGDLQNDPADIPRMWGMARAANLDMLSGVRQKRQDGMFLRKIPSKIANWMIRRASGVHQHDYGCTLRIFRADLAKNLGIYGELHRFIPVLANLEGARMDETPVQHHARQHGQSKYGLGRTMRVLSDLLLILFLKRFRHKPMHLFGGWGVLALFSGSLILVYLMVEKIMGHDIWGRPLLLLGLILFMAGLQLVALGIMAELQVRTYYESQDKKPYRIRKVHEAKQQQDGMPAN